MSLRMRMVVVLVRLAHSRLPHSEDRTRQAASYRMKQLNHTVDRAHCPIPLVVPRQADARCRHPFGPVVRPPGSFALR
uniref:Putative secreted protein n=1 Tax=Anopheles darlingi TaxID=43151 RepID=A0A2M4DNM3_ANODA